MQTEVTNQIQEPPPVQPAQPIAWPKDAKDVRDFFHADFITAQFAAADQTPCDEDRYLISAHDFLSAVNWWANFPHVSRPPQTAPLPLLMRDIARDHGITAFEACQALKDLGNFSVNTAVTAEMAAKLRELFPAPQAAPAAVAVQLDANGIAPCPLCGSESKHVKADVGGHRILCWNDDCECSSGYFCSKEEAITSWNTRAALAATPAMAINPEECAQEVFKNGVSVGLFDIPKETANAICAGISSATSARVDWHYIAGRVHIKALAATPAAAPVALTIPQPFGYVVTTPAGADLFYRHPADLAIHNDHRAETVYTLPAVLAAAPVVLPEPDAVISEVMGLVESYADAVASDMELQYEALEISIKSKLRALLAGVSAPAGFVPVAAYDRLQALCDSQAERILAAEDAEPVHWLAVLDPEQVPHQLKTSMHAVGFRNQRSAESWIAERLDFDGWRYRLEPLYAAPQAQADARDAERYRLLRNEHEGEAESLCVFGPNDMRECLVPIGSLPGELDAFIDAAIAAAKGK
ncbi:Lar family restriction alleviation protein [Comamonas testosteroni]|uniref:Lar family restriction alleviation protein n=1 Tax=Comamonas testosteroni TaxID=285 RepID=UPI0005B31A01|nr:hypothetical protein [Comamonas testosteroni]